MDEKDYITRFEYEERQKRIDDENNRQNHRIDKLETITDQIADMAASIKAMVVTMQAMQKEQEEQGKRLTDIEKKPADNWNQLVYSLIAMIATAAVTYIITKGDFDMFKMSNEVYDILKEIALTILPALAVLYATLGKIWGFPYVGEVPATIMAIDTFLGVCLHISNSEYQKEGGNQ